MVCIRRAITAPSCFFFSASIASSALATASITASISSSTISTASIATAIAPATVSSSSSRTDYRGFLLPIGFVVATHRCIIGFHVRLRLLSNKREQVPVDRVARE